MNATRSLDSILRELQALLPALQEQYHVQSLAIFGSYVRGDASVGSDLDLLVTFSQTPTLFEFVALEDYLSDVLGIKVDLVMKDSLKPAIGQIILAEAQVA